MARPPAGPIGNSPRDVRDDAVGVPAENVTAPEPPRWPPKRKKITSNTFHAKVSGSSSGARADRKPHFRRGGFVKGFASGGTVAGGPVDKNDPKDKAKLKKGGPVAKAGRFQGGGRIDVAGPRAVPRAPLRSEFTEAEKARRTLQRTPPVTIMEDAIGALSEGKAQSNAVRDAIRRGAADTIKESGYEQENKGFGRGYDFKKKGGVVRRQVGGDTGGPSPMDTARAIGKAMPMFAPNVLALEDMAGKGVGGGGGAPGAAPARTGGLGGSDVGTVGGASDTQVGRSSLRSGGGVKKRQEGGLIGPREVQGPVDKYAKDRELGRRQGKEIIRQLRAAPYPRSESTERARALSRLEEDNREADQTGGERTRTPGERMEDVKIIERAGPQFKKGGKVK